VLNVCACTGDLNDPSSRFRVRQYIPELEKYGIRVFDLQTSAGRYPPSNKTLRSWWGGKNLLQHLLKVPRTYRYDLTIVQREFMSTVLTLESFTHAPRVFDLDDAIFFYRGGHAARRLAEMSEVVICGNRYIAEWIERWNRSIEIVPTAVDTDRYRPGDAVRHSSSLVVGWIGTSSNLDYLYAIEPVLASVCRLFPKVRLRVVCDFPPVFQTLGGNQVEFIRWSEEVEIAAIQGMDIGIMPLPDTAWTRGKCSYKMLQYIACGLPVVVSPVGMNREVLAQSDVGIPALSPDEWVEALCSLLTDVKSRRQLGTNGRLLAEKSYSRAVIAPRLAQVFVGAAGSSS